MFVESKEGIVCALTCFLLSLNFFSYAFLIFHPIKQIIKVQTIKDNFPFEPVSRNNS